MRLGLIGVLLFAAWPVWACPASPDQNPYANTPVVATTGQAGLHQKWLWVGLAELSRSHCLFVKAAVADPDRSSLKRRLSEETPKVANAARALLKDSYPAGSDDTFLEAFVLTPPHRLAALARVVRGAILEWANVASLMAYHQGFQKALAEDPQLAELHRDILVSAFTHGAHQYLGNRISLRRLSPNLRTFVSGLATGGLSIFAITHTDQGQAFLEAFPRVAIALIAIAYAAPIAVRALVKAISGLVAAERGLEAMETAVNASALSIVDYRILSTQNAGVRRLSRSWRPRCRQIIQALALGSQWDQPE